MFNLLLNRHHRTVYDCMCIIVVSMLPRFDFSGKTPMTLRRHVESTVEAVADGRCDAVFMWWELEMDNNAQLTLSTAPYWAHPTPDSVQVDTEHCSILGSPNT